MDNQKRNEMMREHRLVVKLARTLLTLNDFKKLEESVAIDRIATLSHDIAWHIGMPYYTIEEIKSLIHSNLHPIVSEYEDDYDY